MHPRIRFGDAPIFGEPPEEKPKALSPFWTVMGTIAVAAGLFWLFGNMGTTTGKRIF